MSCLSSNFGGDFSAISSAWSGDLSATFFLLHHVSTCVKYSSKWFEERSFCVYPHPASACQRMSPWCWNHFLPAVISVNSLMQPIGPQLLCHYHPPSLAMGCLWRVLNLPNLHVGGKNKCNKRLGIRDFHTWTLCCSYTQLQGA